ncbi:pX [Deer mastadenovirus B]|uniref:PX n=1 Tax=Deer mastadenovirus B TaxID=2170000 RepID=A0A1Y0B6H5_9ADEN|nr:pX [Deer mastadenovirus B]ART33370.1 pX [Deer mastadenovirus B]
MSARGNLTYRLRIPVALSRRRRRRTGLRGGSMHLLRHRKRRVGRRMRGGFLPFLAPIIAAAIGAIPGIASVAIQASQNHNK